MALSVFLVFVVLMPRAWKSVEPFAPGSDYRIPYALSKDYWLYQRRLDQISRGDHVLVLGDSVVWGEYVRPDGTLSHFLNRQSGQTDRFLNCGVNGLFPLAMEGLTLHYGSGLRGRKIMLHCNMLWMTGPKADLSADRPENFNHSRLVPQFYPRIPSYRADSSERFSALLDQHSEYFAWIQHLQIAYYGQHSIPQWTLEEDGGEEANYPNAWKNPLAPLKDGIPGEPANDPQRGPASSRHKPWNASGAEPTHFEWVELESSLQWHAFRRMISLLRGRGNDVLVILGPFNEHMVAADQVPIYQAMRDAIANWLRQNHVSVIVAQSLPSDLYADASHPLTQGYALLARRLLGDEDLRQWLSAGSTANQARSSLTMR